MVTANHVSQLCIHCHQKPRYKDGNTTHPYCSKTCAKADSKLCTVCHARPKFGNHNYCGKTCAHKASSNGGSKHPVKDECLMRCGKPCCGKFHFCGKKCATEAEKKAPTLLEIPKDHAAYKSVSHQFQATWKHGTPCPAVQRIYHVVSTSSAGKKYKDYRAAVEGRGKFTQKGMAEGNESRRWHGTRRACKLGDNGHTTLCTSANCSLCAILRTSYMIKFVGSNTGWGRFGRGIYTSSTSSKSNDYVKNATASTSKAMLLNKVVVGKGYKTHTDQPSLTAPPAGHDSVLAEPGMSLNYDELVVYQEEAIRPAYLVVYA
ncbi:ADP-ribosylation [Coniophora puteana RWD-64-598 SS2]|uniref:ADP-ribosylation n=1 Tax=Coniophora puteana (strain RWD-64-598) TaxID=741705 RepID=A0A5M3N0G0_CONPW|nr:ADP-ribosylation [Coniophora puteana RWD-64-598 SS2]EIW84395.1 ADP-ribosylation [Coniophora puteana RWD-64-598 SS2]